MVSKVEGLAGTQLIFNMLGDSCAKVFKEENDIVIISNSFFIMRDLI